MACCDAAILIGLLPLTEESFVIRGRSLDLICYVVGRLAGGMAESAQSGL